MVELKAGGLGFGLCLWGRFWLGGPGSNGVRVEADDGEGNAADAVGQENTKGQRREAGTK